MVTNFPPHGSRIVFKLYWDVAPLACENFKTLCTNGGDSLSSDVDGSNKGKGARPAPVGESGKELTYRNSNIHRVVRGFAFQGGDFVFGNGSGGESIYNGKRFKNERGGLSLKHDRAGILSMGNSGKNSNTSQFFVTLGGAPKCDGRHVVFGEVVSGMEVASAIESVGSTDGGGTRSVPVAVADCGAYAPLVTPGAGSWYDRPDPESYAGVAPEFVARPRVGVVAPTSRACERFGRALGGHASTTAFATDEAEGEGGGGSEAVVRSASRQLEQFRLDVIVVASACANLLDLMDIPSSWNDAAAKDSRIVLPKKEQVLIEAKPVDALSAIMNDSWLGQRPGWLLSASFVQQFR